MVVKDFFNANWLQISIAVLLVCIGSFLFFKSNKLLQSKYATGFFLGLLNPPVLIYWLLVYGIINSNDLMLSLQSSSVVLFLFFVSVYSGKVLTFYLYSKFSLVIRGKFENTNAIISKVTGGLLFFVGLANVFKTYFI